MYDRMDEGIDLGYFITTNGGNVSLEGDKGSDVLGATVESSDFYSADFDYYGSFHNLMHQYLSGMLRAIPEPSPGVQAHQETAMRDRVFYQIHKTVDDLNVKQKAQLTKPYKKEDLLFSGISLLSVKIIPNTGSYSKPEVGYGWRFSGFPQQSQETPVLTTYMQTETFDITNAARPCHSVNDEPVLAQVTTLNHIPFTYALAVQSMRPKVAYGMVRIFIWPEYLQNGTKLEGDDAHVRAIELDRFRVKLNPNSLNIITRNSRNSTITRSEPSPGIKQLYKISPGDKILTNPEIRRACGFPNNLLIPKGTKEGLAFKMTVYISDETDAGEIEENQYPHYPMCGALNGLPFPDKRPMGFPFDRPGTKFSFAAAGSSACLTGCTELLMTNVRQMKVVIKHDDQQNKFVM